MPDPQPLRSPRARALLKYLIAPARRYVEARIGPVRQWVRTRRERRRPRSIGEAMDVLEARWQVAARTSSEPSAAPVFILSASWRSGSTLLQRLLCSDPGMVIWGEPYDHCDLIRGMAQSLTAIRAGYPPDHFLLSNKQDAADSSQALWTQWIANLYPDPVDLLRAHRAFMLALFDAPARERGYARWGLKEVRLGIDHAVYLRWLFPRAKFIFLYRNPYDAYRSFRPCRGWYDRFPDRPVLTPRQFGRHWTRLCGAFVAEHQTVDGVLLPYERLVADETCVAELGRRLQLDLKAEVLRHKVGSSRRPEGGSIPGPELRLLQRVVEPLASRLGYRP